MILLNLRRSLISPQYRSCFILDDIIRHRWSYLKNILDGIMLPETFISIYPYLLKKLHDFHITGDFYINLSIFTKKNLIHDSIDSIFEIWVHFSSSSQWRRKTVYRISEASENVNTRWLTRSTSFYACVFSAKSPTRQW